MEQAKIKFSKDNKEFIIELKELVSDYFKSNNISRYGNWNMAIKSIFMLSLYLTPYFLMVLGVINSFVGVFLCYIIIGVGKAGVGMGVMHDANHRVYSKNKRVNKIMSASIYLVGGFPPTWQRQHNNLHHGFTNIDGRDEDISPVVSVLRFSPNAPLLKVHKFQYLYAWFFYGLMTLMWATTKDFKQLKRYIDKGMPLSRNRSYGQLLTVLIIAKIVYYIVFMVVPLLTLPFAWYWIVLFFFAMHFTSGVILGSVFQSAHVISTSEFPIPDASGSIENSFAVHQLLNTSDFAPNNRILTWLIGGLNYQVEHHLFPGVSHIHYRKISKFVKETAEKHGLPYYVQSGFFKAVFEHGKMLKKLGQPSMV
ncbi:MAG: acyl-CoA desaturase [Salinivirgaceae bacterium]|jgi:linoleoyl-CoA desaturase|nr:acyl-CoA desaturase [Salinivirgaceae bacterium]